MVSTKRYRIKTLGDFDPHDTIATALQREKNIRHWPREWKVDLICGQPRLARSI